jgi:hypothetical protein
MVLGTLESAGPITFGPMRHCALALRRAGVHMRSAHDLIQIAIRFEVDTAAH